MWSYTKIRCWISLWADDIITNSNRRSTDHQRKGSQWDHNRKDWITMYWRVIDSWLKLASMSLICHKWYSWNTENFRDVIVLFRFGICHRWCREWNEFCFLYFLSIINLHIPMNEQYWPRFCLLHIYIYLLFFVTFFALIYYCVFYGLSLQIVVW